MNYISMTELSVLFLKKHVCLCRIKVFLTLSSRYTRESVIFDSQAKSQGISVHL